MTEVGALGEAERGGEDNADDAGEKYLLKPGRYSTAHQADICIQDASCSILTLESHFTCFPAL